MTPENHALASDEQQRAIDSGSRPVVPLYDTDHHVHARAACGGAQSVGRRSRNLYGVRQVLGGRLPPQRRWGLERKEGIAREPRLTEYGEGRSLLRRGLDKPAGLLSRRVNIKRDGRRLDGSQRELGVCGSHRSIFLQRRPPTASEFWSRLPHNVRMSGERSSSAPFVSSTTRALIHRMERLPCANPQSIAH